MACQRPVKFGLPSDIRGMRAPAVCPTAGSTERNAAAEHAATINEKEVLVQSCMGKSANQHIISTAFFVMPALCENRNSKSRFLMEFLT
jgi:hypothetical protein